MQIKEAYQRRIQEKLTPSRYQGLSPTHSSVIGSIQTGRLNYQKTDKFFEDAPLLESVKQAKAYIKDIKDPDILKLKKPRWNNSVEVPKNFEEEESQRSKMLKIRLGFADHRPLKQTPNKIYEGTQSRDNFQGWNVSTYVEQKEKQLGYLYTNANSLKNTVHFNSNKLKNYTSLQSRYQQNLAKQQEAITQDSDIFEELKSSFLFFNHDASPEKTHAVAMKMYDEKKRDQMKLSLSTIGTQDSFSNFKAKMSPTQKSKIKIEDFHTGTWGKDNQQSKKEKSSGDLSSSEEEEQVWSCCMSSIKNSRGCSKRVIDGNKMNLSSFNT